MPVVAAAANSDTPVLPQDGEPEEAPDRAGSPVSLVDAAGVHMNVEGFHTCHGLLCWWYERLGDVGYQRGQLHRGWAGHQVHRRRTCGERRVADSSVVTEGQCVEVGSGATQ